jgi:hypothetical protein
MQQTSIIEEKRGVYKKERATAYNEDFEKDELEPIKTKKEK